MKKIIIIGLMLIAMVTPYNIAALTGEENVVECECVYDEAGNLVEACLDHIGQDAAPCGICQKPYCWPWQ